MHPSTEKEPPTGGSFIWRSAPKAPVAPGGGESRTLFVEESSRPGAVVVPRNAARPGERGAGAVAPVTPNARIRSEAQPSGTAAAGVEANAARRESCSNAGHLPAVTPQHNNRSCPHQRDEGFLAILTSTKSPVTPVRPNTAAVVLVRL